MTLNKFYDLLKRFGQSGSFRSKISNGGWIRTTHPDLTFSKGNLFKNTPMTATCMALGHGDFHWHNDIKAGMALGLPEKVATEIHVATFSKKRGTIRKAMKRCLDL